MLVFVTTESTNALNSGWALGPGDDDLVRCNRGDPHVGPDGRPQMARAEDGDREAI